VIGINQISLKIKNSFAAIRTSFLWTPADITTQVWFDSSDLSTITDTLGAVSQFNDKSGNDRHATQAIGVNQAETGVNTLGGLNTLTMRNGSKFMNVAGSASTIAFYSVVDLDPLAGTGTIAVLGSSGTSTPDSELFFRSTAIGDISFDGSALGTGLGKYSLDGSAFSASGIKNHTTPSAPNSGGHILSGVFDVSFTLAQILNREGLVSDANGHNIGEIVATSAELSLSDRQKLEGYYAWKWGLVANLDVGHPYKLSPPLRD
jgi:hypothetical protein